MELPSAGRSQKNPSKGVRSTQRQRRALSIPPNQPVETVKLYWYPSKIVFHAMLWFFGLGAVTLLHNGWDWVGLGLLIISGAFLASEARWKGPRVRVTRKG